MKRLHDLKKSLPSNARLNIFEKTRVKGGSNNGDGMDGGDKRDGEDDNDQGRPSGNGFGG